MYSMNTIAYCHSIPQLIAQATIPCLLTDNLVINSIHVYMYM